LFVPRLIAFELQGPQHSREVYGSNRALQRNDQAKKPWCRARGIYFVWIDWERFNKDLLKLSFEERTAAVREIIAKVKAEPMRFLCW